MVLSYHCKNANDDEDYDEGIKYYLIYPGSMKKVGGKRAMLIAVFENVDDLYEEVSAFALS